MDDSNDLLGFIQLPLQWCVHRFQQKEAILEYLDSMSEQEREQNKYAIKIVLHEIELRGHSLSNRKFFRNRALLCYKLAYIKAHNKELFAKFVEQNLSE